MKKGTKSRNAGGRKVPIEDPRVWIKRPKPVWKDSIKELFK